MAEIDPLADNPQLSKALEREGIVTDKETEVEEPPYKLIGPKIPVSKSLGKLWSSRIDQSRAAMQTSMDAWSEAIRYYDNDQMGHRKSLEDASGSRASKRIGRGWTSTENVVFANTTTMLPILYAKNPTVECTPKAITNEMDQAWATAAEALINKLFSLSTNPGVNLKPTARRGILWCQLTNAAYSKVGWTEKQDSSEAAIEELRKVSLEYEKAKSAKEIKTAEGKLQALEEKIALLTPSGPSVKLVSPFRIFVDPTSTCADHSDAAWIAEEDYLPTYYLNAVYGRDSEGKIVSTYNPTHVLSPSAKTESTQLEDEVNNFSLYISQQSDQQKEAKSYGYKSTVAYKNAQYTKVYWIWDKTTRRLYLYADNKWDWPLWVWDDPLKLLEFYPYDHLWFHEALETMHPKGEVTYYLDQQDSINDNNSTIAQARDWAKNKIMYNRNMVTQEAAEKYLSGPDGTAVPIDLPEGMKIGDAVWSATPPALAYPDLLNNAPANEYISRVTGITAAQQGAQFKTNTTNDAINFYQKSVDIRVDEKVDCIEDWIGKIGWKLIQMAAQRWEVEDVAEIIGPDLAKGWKRVSSPEELRRVLSLRVVGGSSDKPTSRNKKTQALELGQVLGQFGQGIPAIGITALKVLERAFSDEMVMSAADWQIIMQSLNDQANAAGGGPAGAGGSGGSEGAPAGGGDENAAVREQVAALINKLPPEMKGALEAQIAEGVPPQQALEAIMAQAQQGQVQ